MSVYDEDIELLLPFYLNGTLDEVERAHVETALDASERLQAALHDAEAVRRVWQMRESPTPPSAVRQALVQAVEPRWPRAVVWLWQACILLLVGVLVWYAVSPGIVLRWTVDPAVAETYAAFVVYRQVDGASPQQVAVFPAESRTSFVFVDSLVRPDREYAYRVVAVDAQGVPQATMVARERGQSALFYQVATLALAAILGGVLARMVMPLLRVSPRLSSVRL
nr:hypothetical protein [Ardenticatena sp.]